MQDSSSKRRFYLNRKTQSNSYSSPNKYENKIINDIKASNNISKRGRILGLNTDSFDLMKKTKRNYTNRVITEEDNYLNRSQLKLQRSNENIFKNAKNISNFKSPSSGNMLNDKKRSIINNNRDNYNLNSNKYYNYLQKKSDNKTITQDKEEFGNDFANNKNKNYKNYKNYNDNKDGKNTSAIITLNNNDIKKNYRNHRYNLSKDKYNNNLKINFNINNKREKNYTPSKNINPRFVIHNRFNDRKKIIKIQSVGIVHYLRKIAVGSVKKYIGFVALVKYIEKIFDNYKKKILNKAFNILKDYIYNKNLKYRYRRINRVKNIEDSSEKKANRRYRNFKNLTKDDRDGKDMFKNNYLFNRDDLEPLKN